MIDYRKSIVEVANVHGETVSDEEVEETNAALNALIDDYIVEDDMTEADADALITDNFWDYVRDILHK